MFNLWGIRNNIIFLVLAPTVLISMVLSVYFILDRINILETSHRSKGATILTSVSLMAQAYSEEDKAQLLSQITKIRDSDRDILAIAILRNNSDFFINVGSGSFLEQLKIDSLPKEVEQQYYNEYLQITAPTLLQKASEPFYVSVLIDRHPLRIESYHTIFIIGLITLGIVTLSLSIALHLSRSIGTPLQKITYELEAINDGKLDLKIHTPDIPELAKISDTINSLASSLSQAKANMQHNIDQATSDLTQTLETIEIQNIELDMARKQAIQASRVKSEFLANISHEIRTPMNGVIGFTNLLLNSKVDTTQKDYLLTIRKSANNLLSIIEDILDFSKIEAGKMTLDKMSFSLRDCVEEVVTMLSPSSVKKNIELIPLIYKNVPEQLLGDPVRVKQILTNLVSNAIKFTEKGSIVVRVLLEDDRDDCQIIRTTITDTGMGMTDEQINKLFQPFSQVNQSINRHHSGTGLGLVICKKLVEQMGGEITVESKSNEGTSFSYTIISEKISDKLSQQNQKTETHISLPGQTVLVFDSHPMALLAMKQLLSSWDMDVHDFQSIDKLLADLEQLSVGNDIEPIIMLGLTNESRYLSETLAKLGKYNSKALFILGNATDQHEITQFLDKGVSQYLEKPLTRKQLGKSFAEIGLIDKKVLATASTDQNKNQFSQLRILAVDDNPANLKLITIVLEEMSIDVIQAYDGLSAVEICKEKTFDLIFMDIRMPGLDGIEASQRIRKDSMNQRTPIIALTAHAMAGEKEQLLSNGLEDYMTKPVSTFQLEQIISKWTGQIAVPVEESIDWTACLDISGGRDKLAREMLADLVSAIPEFKHQLANKTIDQSELLSNVHKLHGLACYTGVPKTQKLASKLETKLKSDAPARKIESLQSALITELEQVEKDAANYLSKV